MLEVCEIFSSIQGEGWRQGIPAIFVRLYGCNLKCSFCDTPEAFTRKILLDEKEIMKKVDSISKGKILNVVITGGEPYLQDFSNLCSLLKKKGYFVSVETNGTIWRDIKIDWICVSPKRQAKKMFKDGYDRRFRDVANEFKYIIEEKADINFIDKKIKCPVILQPVNNDLAIAQIISKELEKTNSKNWFLRLQMHKILGVK